MPNHKIICGDARSYTQKIETDSIDMVFTDPPYALVSGSYKGEGKHSGGFMNKKWDSALPSVAVWQECLRVLKPGAFAFVMSAPRQDVLSRMIVNIEDAGFNVAFPSIYHTYSAGFPKASNISKQIDKQACMRELTEELDRKPTKKEFEKKWEGFREVVGSYEHPDGNIRNWKEHNPDNSIAFKNKPLKYSKAGRPISTSTTPEAKALAGFYGGYSPKPCLECVLVAMKPLEHSTYVAQALDNGHGCTNLDAGRIPYESEDDKYMERPVGKIQDTFSQLKTGAGSITSANTKGRFAPHLLVEDDVFSCVRDKGTKPHPVTCNIKSYEGWGSIMKKDKVIGNYGDSGSFSRYFSLDAWWDARIAELPEEVQKTFPFLLVPKASQSERNKGLKGTTNTHCTVKPVKLISYLVTIATREGDTVLDLYVGSGTTLVVAELLNRNCVGIDIDKEHCETAYARLNEATAQTQLNVKKSTIKTVGF